MFCIKEKHVNCALCELCLSLFAPEIQRTFEEEMIANPNMKFKDMYASFWSTHGRLTKEEAKINKDRLMITWQPHKGGEALVA